MVPLNEDVGEPMFASEHQSDKKRGLVLLSSVHNCMPNPNKTEEQQEGEEDTWSWMPSETQPVVDLISIQGICHIDLLGAQFKITHNEDNNDFFIDLVQSEGILQSVLQVIFRFPKERNDFMQIFASSYDLWKKAGRVVVHSPNSSRCDEHWQKRWHVQLHVYEHCYTIELNGRLIETFEHRMAFRKVEKSLRAQSHSSTCLRQTEWLDLV